VAQLQLATELARPNDKQSELLEVEGEEECVQALVMLLELAHVGIRPNILGYYAAPAECEANNALSDMVKVRHS